MERRILHVHSGTERITPNTILSTVNVVAGGGRGVGWGEGGEWGGGRAGSGVGGGRPYSSIPLLLFLFCFVTSRVKHCDIAL